MPSRRAFTIGLLVLATMLAVLWTPAAAEGRSESNRIARYDKSKAQCKGNKLCLRGYRYRKRCFSKPRGSTSQNACYIRYAAWYYGQNPNEAIATAKCESGPQLDKRAVSPGGTYYGNWQFDKATWAGAPHSTKIVRTARGSVVRDRRGRAKTRRRSRFSVKYSSLGAMWYWRKGERSRWPVCGR